MEWGGPVLVRREENGPYLPSLPASAGESDGGSGAEGGGGRPGREGGEAVHLGGTQSLVHH